MCLCQQDVGGGGRWKGWGGSGIKAVTDRVPQTGCIRSPLLNHAEAFTSRPRVVSLLVLIADVSDICVMPCRHCSFIRCNFHFPVMIFYYIFQLLSTDLIHTV